MEVENTSYDTLVENDEHVMLDFDYMVTDDTKRLERKPDSKRKYNYGAERFLWEHKLGYGVS